MDIDYIYPAFYYEAPTEFAQAFANVYQPVATEILRIGRDRDLLEVTRGSTWQIQLRSHTPIPSTRDFGGWNLSVQHLADLAHDVVYLGTGGKRSASSLDAKTVAGVGGGNYFGDGGLAIQSILNLPTDVETTPDGGFYIADDGNHRIRYVGPNGIIRTVAGRAGRGGYGGFGGDGLDAIYSAFRRITGLALGSDGNLFVVDRGNHRIRRIGQDGIIVTVAGNSPVEGSGEYGGGDGGYSGDGDLATQANLSYPYDVALGPDGSLYIADAGNHRIRRIGLNGIITTVAGNGAAGYSGGNGGPATQTSLDWPEGLAVAPNGDIYISDTFVNRIRRVGPDGKITTVAGNGIAGDSGDGGPATQASLSRPSQMAIGTDGSLYIADRGNGKIRRVGPDGIITTVAGNGTYGDGGDGAPATQTSLQWPSGLALAPDGGIYIADTWNHRIRRVASNDSDFVLGDALVASASSGEVYHFNTAGRHLRTLDTLTKTPRQIFAYDTEGHLLDISDRDGNITHIARDASGRPTAIVAPDGQRTTLTLDAKGYLASVTNPAGEIHRMVYTPDGLLTQFTDPKGNSNQFEYDDLGRLLKDTDPVGGGWTLARTENVSGYTNTLTSGEGRSSRFAVEPQTTGDRKQVNTAPDGTVVTKLFKTNGETTTTAPDASVTTVLEGPDPRFGMQSPLPTASTVKLPSGLTANGGTTRSVSLADATNPLSLKTLTETATVNDKATTRSYDAATKTWTVKTPAARQSTLVVNDKGRPVSTQIPGLEALQFHYDARGRLIETSQGSGAQQRTATVSYYVSGPAQGYPQAITDALNRSVSFAYDAAGRVTQKTLPDGRTIGFQYDANGNLTALTPPGAPAHVFSYTPADQEAQYTPPSVVGLPEVATRYVYNRDKQLTRITRPDGQALTLTYDTGGRLSQLTTPTGPVAYAYTPATGQLASVTAPGGTTLSHTWDGFLNTATAWAGPVTGEVKRSYNNDFDITALSVNGQAVTYRYDADGLLTQAGDLSLSRNAQNGLITGTSLSTLTDTRGYSGFGELSAYAAKVGTSSVYSSSYGRDALGRIIEKTEIIQDVTIKSNYTYDTAGRLTEVKENGAVTSTYAYDANGNRTQHNATTGEVDAQDRLTRYGDATYTYTANGELKTQTDGSGTTTYDYDILGNLRKVKLPDSTTIEYVIDGQNRRIGRKVNGTLTQGWLYQDQLRPIAELDGQNNVTARFVYGDKANVPAYLAKNGITYRIISDHLGSPRLVIDLSTGNVIQRIDYDEFGKVLSDTNPGFQPFGFAGGLYDKDTGLVRFGARDYDAETGRWTAKDPIRFGAGDTNLYAYVLNDPLNFNDSFGLAKTTVDAAIEQAIKRGDIAELQTILETPMSEGQIAAARAGIERLSSTAETIISNELKGSVRSEFPGELLEKTLAEIMKGARGGDKACQTAKKLMSDSRFKKGS